MVVCGFRFCDDPVPPGRRVFCSGRCAEREYTRRETARRRANREARPPTPCAFESCPNLIPAGSRRIFCTPRCNKRESCRRKAERRREAHRNYRALTGPNKGRLEKDPVRIAYKNRLIGRLRTLSFAELARWISAYLVQRAGKLATADLPQSRMSSRFWELAERNNVSIEELFDR